MDGEYRTKNKHDFLYFFQWLKLNTSAPEDRTHAIGPWRHHWIETGSTQHSDYSSRHSQFFDIFVTVLGIVIDINIKIIIACNLVKWFGYDIWILYMIVYVICFWFRPLPAIFSSLVMKGPAKGFQFLSAVEWGDRTKHPNGSRSLQTGIQSFSTVEEGNLFSQN